MEKLNGVLSKYLVGGSALLVLLSLLSAGLGAVNRAQAISEIEKAEVTPEQIALVMAKRDGLQPSGAAAASYLTALQDLDRICVESDRMVGGFVASLNKRSRAAGDNPSHLETIALLKDAALPGSQSEPVPCEPAYRHFYESP